MFKVSITTFLVLLMAPSLPSQEIEIEKSDDSDQKAKRKALVKKMMIAVHRGNDTPIDTIANELKSRKPNWSRLRKNADFVEVLSDIVLMDSAADNEYTKLSRDLLEGIRKREIKKAVDGLKSYKTSCISCHGWGASFEKLRSEIPLQKKQG